jgi:hypothetical protein
MSGHGERLSRKKSEVIAALLGERTVADAAARVGVAESTLHRWLRRPDFQEAYRAARRAIVDAAVGQVQQASAEAIEALRRNLKCQSPAAEVRAAQVILDVALRGVELSDLQGKVEELDKLLVELKSREGTGPKGN